ncbi:hypothetical protein PAPHI01_0309 [Pancytospora philotis]|nr:hypothetical protein PAPHI01_0309 [Pancytospora philotis]
MRGLLFLLTVAGSDLDRFIDRDVRVFFASANHVFVGLDTASNRLAARSKYYALAGFNALVKLVPSGDSYRMLAKRKPLCVNGDGIAPCSSGSDWTVREQPFGYTIGDGVRCLTLSGRAVITMAACTDSEDQLVDFRLAEDDQECWTGGAPSPDTQTKAPHSSTVVLNLPEGHRNDSGAYVEIYEKHSRPTRRELKLGAPATHDWVYEELAANSSTE